jgi:hypothetical protein
VIDQVVVFTGSNAPTGFVESDSHTFVDARINAGDVDAPVDADQTRRGDRRFRVSPRGRTAVAHQNPGQRTATQRSPGASKFS